MNLKIILYVLIGVSLILETTLITFPLTYILVLALYSLYPKKRTIITAFFAGLILDSLKLSPIGITSIIFLFSFLGFEMMKQVSELKDFRINILIIAVLSFIYAEVFSYSANILIYALVFGLAAFTISYFNKRVPWGK